MAPSCGHRRENCGKSPKSTASEHKPLGLKVTLNGAISCYTTIPRLAPLPDTAILQKKIQHRKETQKSVENESEFQEQTMAIILQGLISVWGRLTNDAALQKNNEKHGLVHQPHSIQW